MITITDDTKDTWIFPLVQMGEFGITQDEQVTKKFLATVPEGSIIRLATGYFNLTNEYAKTLLNYCKANISLLMAHPNVSVMCLFSLSFLFLIFKINKVVHSEGFYCCIH